MKRTLYIVAGIVVLVITVAQVKATRTAPPAQQQQLQQHSAASDPALTVSAEGRVVAYPGAEVTVGTDVAGTIARLTVEEKDVVKKGQIIAEIKADDARAALAEAKSRVGEADADIRLFELEVARAKSLWQEDVGSKQAWEKSERDLDAARARRESSVAEVRRLEATLAKTVITAPISGVVIVRVAHAGETVAIGDELVTIANLDRTRVEAEVDEYDAARMVLGGQVSITAEGYHQRTWRGTIEEIPDAVTSRRLKPQDPSKPVDTRVLLVKVALAEPTPLKLGQRVEVQIGGK